MEMKKKLLLYRISIAVLLSVVVILIAVPVFKVLNSSVQAIIKDKDMNYFRVEKVYICGSTLICRADSESAGERSKLPEVDRSRFSFKIFSIPDIVSIEFLQEEDTAVEDSAPVHAMRLGKFKIHLQGHEGILFLGVSDERVYGTVRFPQWGKGAVETLKGLRISGGEIKFTRSASTQKEVQRLGANYLFKQKFSGTYSSSGKVIKGFMVNDRGEKYEWEAEKR